MARCARCAASRPADVNSCPPAGARGTPAPLACAAACPDLCGLFVGAEDQDSLLRVTRGWRCGHRRRRTCPIVSLGPAPLLLCSTTQVMLHIVTAAAAAGAAAGQTGACGSCSVSKRRVARRGGVVGEGASPAVGASQVVGSEGGEAAWVAEGGRLECAASRAGQRDRKWGALGGGVGPGGSRSVRDGRTSQPAVPTRLLRLRRGYFLLRLEV